MSEAPAAPEASAGRVPASAAPSPGALIRALRERQGVHQGVLAATLKVSPRKLEMLEADRFDQLPDATFVKALALAVCRALKADPSEVMAAYAARDLAADPFKDVGKGINEPVRTTFRGPVLPTDTSLGHLRRRWWFLLALLIVVAALAIAWFTGALASVFSGQASVAPARASVEAIALTASSPAAGALSAEAPAPPATPAQIGTAASAPSSNETVAASRESAGPPPVLSTPSAGGPGPRSEATLKVSTSADSWVEVVDASRRVLWSQVVPEGESVQLVAVPPLQVVIGNARATRLELEGQTVDLAAHVRGNVARLQLP